MNKSAIKKNSLARKIMLGFILTIVFFGIIISICCQHFNYSYIKDTYRHLAESCAKSAANSLFDFPVDAYLKNGKNKLYEEQLAILNSICKNFNLKYLYVYVPDFENNIVTSVFYLDGKTDGNVKGRDLGVKVPWTLTQQEKDTFSGLENNSMFEADNQMGHTVTSYAVIRNSKGLPVALVGADLDYNAILSEMADDVLIIILFITLCLLVIYLVLMLYLNKVFIKPIVEFSDKMREFTTEKSDDFVPIQVRSDDEFGMMAESFNIMVQDIKNYMDKISKTQIETIFSLAKLSQSRDDDTGKHLERVQLYCYILSKKLKENSPYSNLIDDKFIENIVNASPLHDIGKVGISDLILLKPEKFTPEEYEVMKTHTIIGYETLNEVHTKFGENAFIEMGMVVALSHHERWDGKGYPHGLKGFDIPLPARIMAIADVYDALSTKRVYKPPFLKEKCIDIIKEGRGTQFDPVIVDAFLQVADEFDEVSKTHSD